MTPRQILLVQQTFALVQPVDEVAALFYERLFTLDPALRCLFKGDMPRQGRMLMAMIGAAVNGLSRPEQLAPVVHQLGARHAGYGVQHAHYATVAAALLWTLESGLGEHFTPEVSEAWGTAYGLLAGLMQEGAAQVAASQPADLVV